MTSCSASMSSCSKSLCLCLLFAGVFSGITDAFPRKEVGDPLAAIQGLVTRVLGSEYVNKFQYEVISDEDGYDAFEIDKGTSAPVVLRGNNGVALASALNGYLKYYCNCSISWGVEGTGDQLKLPNPLPAPPTKSRYVSPVKYRYYQNVCTVSYSMAWWDFARWEREIDWMAMNGLNLPLSFTGQEVVWQKLFTQIGLTAEEIKEYFSGAAFLAWQRMGNIRGWGGPLDDDWIKKQGTIQSQIVERVRLFGMSNALPGFSGHVPEGLKRVFPNAKLIRSAGWGNFNETYSQDYLLEPTDPLFMTLGAQFYQLLIAEYGTDHIYNADTYNEMNPSSTDLDFLADTNKAIYDAMAGVDKEAVFLMQGWLFHSGFWTNDRIKAFLSKVPNDNMIILDLNSEVGPIWSRTDSYFGKPFIWCLLHNYGGTRGIYGDLETIATGPVQAKQASGSTMIGTGMTPEAIEHNPVVYDLMGEMGWVREEVNVSNWLQYYASRRYGGYSPLTETAWSILKDSAYHHHFSWSIKSIMDRGPGWKMTVDTGFNVTGLVDAWMLLYEAGKKGQVSPSVGPYQYDLVDIGRQCLTDLFYDMYRMYSLAYEKFTMNGTNSTDEMSSIANEMLTLLTNIDDYLGTNINFLLGRWIETARNSAASNVNQVVVDNLEYNARNQITMWGPHQNIEDYASKEWSGLVADYYKERWSLFFQYGIKGVRTGLQFNNTEYQEKRFELEQGFSEAKKTYPTTPSGDVMQLTETLVGKYMSDYSQRYHQIINTDVAGHNLFGGNNGPWTRNLYQVAYLCDINPSCHGFTNLGYMKNSSSDQVSSPGNCFYAKI